MIWLNNIQDLQYYHPIPGVPCFCDIIVFPADMILQGAFNPGSGSYTLLLEVYSADGLTLYANGTSYFSSYFAVNTITGQHFFNARLDSFVPAMCTHACYIVHAKVTDGDTVLFDKYTERYCQSSCCDLARNINIAQTDITITGGGDGTLTGGGTITSPVNPKLTECGDALITLRTQYDCYDKFTGIYYGTPATTLSGSATFGYENITNFRGRVVPRPRDIKREYSYNCRIQRVESTKTYLFEGFEFFPAWKMIEIEAQLHSTRIYVDDLRYEYGGGTPFSLITASNCLELFKLSTTLQECTQRQVFGCSDNLCSPIINFDGAMKMYVIPDAAQGIAFYNEGGVAVATDYAGLLIYMRALPGITELNDIDITGLDCTVYKAFSISGIGYIPTYFYFDTFTTSNKVLSTALASIDDICTQYANPCVKPDLGTPVAADNACPVPDLGDYTIEDMTASSIPLANRGDWEVSAIDSSASLWNGEVTLNLSSSNSMIPEDPENPGDPVFINGQIIAVIGGTGRPDNGAFLDSTNSNLAEGNALSIDENGLITYSGYTTTSDSEGSTVILTNIRYNIH